MAIQPLRVIERIEYSDHVEEERKRWPAGEWDKEPDLVEWRDEATGYPCLVVRGPMGSLCGYVGVPEGHPEHGKNHNDAMVGAHGGLTYSGACAGHICHVPQPGEADSVWWLGFDCAHAGDVSPRLLEIHRRTEAKLKRDMPQLFPEDYERGDTYKTLAYVQNECTELAAELKGLA